MAKYKGPIIDADLHHNPKTREEVWEFLPEHWRDYAKSGGKTEAHRTPLFGAVVPHHAQMSRTYGSGKPGSDYGLVKEQLLDRFNIFRVVLNGGGAGVTEPVNPNLGPLMGRAFNDWNVATWLEIDDDRIYSVVHIPGGDPQQAADEIRRVGGHPKIVAAQLTAKFHGRPYGDPLYDPIYEAASEMGLNIDIHPGRSSWDLYATGTLNSSVVAVPLGLMETAMHHVTSYVANGTFEKFPNLRVMIKEHGVSWIQHVMWQLDKNYKVLKAESPWVKRLPSEYVREHIRIGTQPLEQGFTKDGADVKQLLENTDGLDDMLCYASDYPHTTYDDPLFIAKRLPEEWVEKVMYLNACEHYKWDPPPADFVNAGERQLVPAG